MDRNGVQNALIRHINLPLNGALLSNDCLATFLKNDNSGRLRGVWCLLPDCCNELPPIQTFLDSMKENKIAALTLSPFNHRWIPNRIVIGRTMDAIAERNIPVLMDAFDNKWDAIYAFVEQFPKNKLLLTCSHKHGFDRFLRPLMDTYPNLYFIVSGCRVPEGVNDLVNLYGAKRILYGSDFPHYNHGNMMLPIKQSGLSQEDIQDIAGRNLENLLKGGQL